MLYAIHVGMQEGDWVFLDWSPLFKGEIIFGDQC